MSALLVLIAGMSRILLDSPPFQPPGAEQDLKLADCLASGQTLPVGSVIELTPFSPDGADAAQLALPTLRIEARAPVEVLPDLVSPATAATLVGGAAKVSSTVLHLQPPARGGSAVVAKSAGARYLMPVDRGLDFRPVDQASYAISLLPREPDGKVGTARSLDAGTTGTVALVYGQAIMLAAAQPISVSPLPSGVNARLFIQKAIGRSGLAGLSVQARESGMRFDSAGVALTACAWTETMPPTSVGIVETKAAALGAATVELDLPSNLQPTSSQAITTVNLAIASSDGRYVAFGNFREVGRLWAGLISVVVIAAILFGLLNVRHATLVEDPVARKKDWSLQWYGSLFIGPDGDPSLSLFQIFFWTLIVVWGLVYVFIVTGSLLTLTTGVLALIGIAGTGSVLARAAASRTDSGSTSQAQGAEQQPLEFWQLLNTDGNFDLLKLQLLVFTIVIGVYVVLRIGDNGAFPDLDPTTLGLLGVSQGMYIGGKFAKP